MSSTTIAYDYDYHVMSTTGEFSHRISMWIKYGSDASVGTIVDQVFEGFRLYEAEHAEALEWLKHNNIEFLQHREMLHSTVICFKRKSDALWFKMTR